MRLRHQVQPESEKTLCHDGFFRLQREGQAYTVTAESETQ
jgi:hypothetical protein